MEDCNIWYVGGKHSPYIWLKCPNNMTSWEFFDYLLNNAQVVGTPGAGFGKNGEGYFRLTSFGSKESIMPKNNAVDMFIQRICAGKIGSSFILRNIAVIMAIPCAIFVGSVQIITFLIL